MPCLTYSFYPMERFVGRVWMAHAQFGPDSGIDRLALWDLLLGGASDVQAVSLTTTFRAETFQSWLVTWPLG